jgi:MarR family transcriptional regulator, transcriptional regulator for hemolysin
VPTSNRPPIGLALNRAARIVGRAFDEALTEAGGSLPIWLVLLNVETGQASTQRSLAAALGLREPTLSHHLAAMESDGLITRRRDDANRRVQVVALTDAGRTRFRQLRKAAIAFDQELRRGIDDADLALVEEVLARLSANVS